MARAGRRELDETRDAPGFDFSEPAELYCGSGRGGRTTGMTYRRFDATADAVRYVVEELSGIAQRGCVLEVNESRFNHLEIHKLYNRSDYPLPRQAGKETNGT